MKSDIPENNDQVALIDAANNIFTFNKNGIQYMTGTIEIYKFEIEDDHKMSFYIPLKK